MARKTINVADFVAQINHKLAPDDHSVAFRQGLISVLDDTLHATDNYHGFRYLTESQVPEGELPGIRHDENGEMIENFVDRFTDTDATRVHYF